MISCIETSWSVRFKYDICCIAILKKKAKRSEVILKSYKRFKKTFKYAKFVYRFTATLTNFAQNCYRCLILPKESNKGLSLIYFCRSSVQPNFMHQIQQNFNAQNDQISRYCKSGIKCIKTKACKYFIKPDRITQSRVTNFPLSQPGTQIFTFPFPPLTLSLS